MTEMEYEEETMKTARIMPKYVYLSQPFFAINMFDSMELFLFRSPADASEDFGDHTRGDGVPAGPHHKPPQLTIVLRINVVD